MLEATKQLEGQSVAFKNELLFQRGINFDKLPNWQKRGMGVWWADIPKEGFNPITKETVLTTRRELNTEYDLPLREEYATFIAEILSR